jgi:hypothetical protein
MTAQEIALELTKSLLENRMQIKLSGLLKDILPQEAEALTKAYGTIYVGVRGALKSRED